MGRYLLLDIGAGTLDILFVDDVKRRYYKAVVASPILSTAQAIQNTRGDLFVDGVEMGGGAVSAALKSRVGEGARVVMTESAAATVHHNRERVSRLGIEVVPDGQSERYHYRGDFQQITLADIDLQRLADIVTAMGVGFEFDVVAACAQDHGVAPRGTSHLDFRHRLFVERLNQSDRLETLLYEIREVPAAFNRLRCMAHSALALPTSEVYVMDSGMAAILGASLDRACRSADRAAMLDVATSHTVGATLQRGNLAGFFEYHTAVVTPQKIDQLTRELADGSLEHAVVLAQGGHGAHVLQAVGYESLRHVIATGPKRALVQASRLPIRWGAPMGDNMMTGTAGLLEAVRRRKGKPTLADIF
jgi:uncharacterized protein (DUF1786 family)